SDEDQRAFEAALAEYIAGQEFLGDQPGSHLNLAVVYTSRGQPDKAEQEYRRALRIEPGFVPARINLAMLLDELGRKDEAESQFRLAIDELQRQIAAAQRQAAVAGTPKPQPAGRQRPLDQMIEHLRGQQAECHYSLGLLLAERKDRMEEAAASLAAAAAMSPRNPRVHYNLGLALQTLGRMAQAEQSLLTARNLAPEAPDFHRALAILYTQLGRWQDAATSAEQLVALAPHDPNARALLQLIVRQGNNAGKP
ncbi:MAG: tetratricopeptide repeat protein, partial [Thermoguttaceae bacterium]|nr:tetratricopeptide repeat protein [Thermoguttaceae bacterium]